MPFVITLQYILEILSHLTLLAWPFLSDWFYICVLFKCIVGCGSLLLIIPENTGRVSDLTVSFTESLFFPSHQRTG